MKLFILSCLILLICYPKTISYASQNDGVFRSKRSFSESEKRVVVEEHNKYRRMVSPTASDMREMIWDEDVASVAEAHAKKCQYEHNTLSNRKTSKFSIIGENLFLSSMEYPIDEAIAYGIKEWDNEKTLYTYSSSSCSGVCGHYTQNVWAESYALGCAIATCENMNVHGSVWPTAQFLVCNYGPPGNFIGKKPYTQGAPCSLCPVGTKCNSGLCCDPASGCGSASAVEEASPKGIEADDNKGDDNGSLSYASNLNRKLTAVALLFAAILLLLL